MLKFTLRYVAIYGFEGFKVTAVEIEHCRIRKFGSSDDMYMSRRETVYIT